MTPKRIKEIASEAADEFYNNDFREDLEIFIIKAITKALEEQNRWYYPEKGELPDPTKQVLVCFKANTIMTGWIRFDELANRTSFFQQGEEDSFDLDFIKCWRYAPEVPGGIND